MKETAIEAISVELDARVSEFCDQTSSENIPQPSEYNNLSAAHDVEQSFDAFTKFITEMHPLALLLVASTASTVNANLLQTDTTPAALYLASVCSRRLQRRTQPLLPCNAAYLLAAECVFGPNHDGPALLHGHITTSTTPRTHRPLSIESQRARACESNLLDLMQACGACEAANGGGAVLLAYLGEKCFASVSSAYCKPSSMHTLDFSNFFQEWMVGEHRPAWLKSKLSAASTSSLTDPIGSTATAVSLYYTCAVAGSKELQVPDFRTGSNTVPRSKVTSVTSTPTRSQLAVVTANSSSSGSVSTASSRSAAGAYGRNRSSSTIPNLTGGVAQQTEYAAVIGLLGAAAFVAILSLNSTACGERSIS